MRLFLAALLFLVPVAAQDTRLIDHARELLPQPGQRGEAEALLQQAIAQAPDNPEPLTLFAVLRQADLQNDPGELRVQVEPLFTRLLMLRRQTAGTKPGDLALALELNARLLDQMQRSDKALPLRTQAQGIRRAIVQEQYGAERMPGETVYKIGARLGVSVPSVQTKTDPEYTDAARLVKMTGTVLVSVVIGADGVPGQIELVRGAGFGLDEKAAEAVSKWRFKPATKDGAPVRVQARIEVNFRLL